MSRKGGSRTARHTAQHTAAQQSTAAQLWEASGVGVGGQAHTHTYTTGALHCIPLNASAAFFAAHSMHSNEASGSDISPIDLGLISHAYSSAHWYDKATFDWLSSAIMVVEEGT